jgi:phospholipid/cholesterol/gamma-HCH transport system ATP-binding protein
VWKSYGGNSILKGLSLQIAPSAITVILGRSGVGKSVLLRHIAGLETVDDGEIEIDGSPISTLTEKERSSVFRQVGMLFQSSALFDSMTVEENVAFSLQHQEDPLPNSTIYEEVRLALEKVGLQEFHKKYPSDLSGGQKRRAALARLIVYKPKVLLFDEPTTGLDPITAHHIALLISETQRLLDATVIVVTHDIPAALTVGKYFALHHEGVIRLFGEKDEFFSSRDEILQSFMKSCIVPDQYIQHVSLSGEESI